MLKQRIIPLLQLLDNSLVKTTKFKRPRYIGDPTNTVRIFNELEVDELSIVDIKASIKNFQPNFDLLSKISKESFMPLSYGGGIKDVRTALKIIKLGYEKIILNSSILENVNLITEISKEIGNQSLIVSVDIKKNFLGKYIIYGKSGSKKYNIDFLKYLQMVEEMGAGEILVTSIDLEGTWLGLDIELVNKIVNRINIPLIVNGGVRSSKEIKELFSKTNASAVAVGSTVVFQKKDMGVLINYPFNKN